MALAGLKSLLKRDKGKDKADWSRPEDWQDFVLARRTWHPIQRRALTDKALARRFSNLEWCERDALIMTLEQELGLTCGSLDQTAKGTSQVWGEEAGPSTSNRGWTTIWDYRGAEPCPKNTPRWRASSHTAQDDDDSAPKTWVETLYRWEMDDRKHHIQNSLKMNYLESKFGSLGGPMLRKLVAELDRILGTSEPLEEDERGVLRQENVAAGSNSRYCPTISYASRTTDYPGHGYSPYGAAEARWSNTSINSDGVSVIYAHDGYPDWSNGYMNFMSNDEQLNEDAEEHRHGRRANGGDDPTRGSFDDTAYTHKTSLPQTQNLAGPVEHRHQNKEAGREMGSDANVSNHEEAKRQREVAERQLDEAGLRHDEAKRRLEQEKRVLEQERAKFQRMLRRSRQHDNEEMEADPQLVGECSRLSSGGREPSQLPPRSSVPSSTGCRDGLRCNNAIFNAVAHNNDGMSDGYRVGGSGEHEAAQHQHAPSPVSDDGFDIHDAPPAYSEWPTEQPPRHPANFPLRVRPRHAAAQRRNGYAQQRFCSGGPSTSTIHPNGLAELEGSTPQRYDIMGSIPIITVQQYYEIIEPEAPTTSRLGGRVTC